LAWIDAFLEGDAGDEGGGEVRRLALVDLEAHDLAAVDVHDEIQEEELAADDGGQVGDVPAPDLVGPGGDMLLGPRDGWPGAFAMGELLFVVQHAIDGRHGRHALAAHDEPRDDLLGREILKFRRVGDPEDRRPFVVGELVDRGGAWTVAAIFAALLRPPTLLGTPIETDDRAGLCPARSGGDRLLHVLQDFLPLDGRVSSPSSPQRALTLPCSSRAAVSASAFSLRRSSLSSWRTRLLSAVLRRVASKRWSG
jgi:hypothetical protein